MKVRIFIVFMAAAMLLAVVSGGQVSALQIDRSCSVIEGVFARGSGQKLNDQDREFGKFSKAFNEKFDENKISRTIYELGVEAYGNQKYPAVDIGIVNGNALGAKVSSGYANDYGKSVDSGVGELYNYMTQRHAKCKSSGTKYILAGYSQGAQVVGQTLLKFSPEIRKDIAHVGLYGDPKLTLDEGRGLVPPACRGQQFSPWRRVVENCRTSAGALNARKPYTPSDIENRVGLWCYKRDYVCGSTNNVFITDGHQKYKDDNRAIDQSVLEAAKNLKTMLPAEIADDIKTQPDPGLGTTGLDVAFVLDTTGSMSGQIEATKEFIRESAQKIKLLNGRVSLTVYRDKGDEYTARILSPLQSSMDDLLEKLDTVEADGGDDWPEAGLHALMTTMNGLNWTDGATKAAIVLTDAPFHEPDMVDNTTVEQVAKRSLEIDPVNVYPVLPSWTASDSEFSRYDELAKLTSGQIIHDEGDTTEALKQALTKIETRPTALLKNSEYFAEAGQVVRFDASDSYVADGTITKYDWDFDGDGEYEKSTSEPVVEHVYNQDFEGQMQVRLTASNSTIASASAMIKIGPVQAPVLPQPPKNLTVKASGKTANLSWQSTDNLVNWWNLRLNGVSMGSIKSSQTSIEVQDIDRSQLNTFELSSVMADGTEGDYASVELKPETSPTDPSKLSWWQLLWQYIKRLIISWI